MEPIHQDPEAFDAICQWSPMPPKLIGDKVFLTAFDPECTDDFLRFMTDETTAMGLGSPLFCAYSHDEEYGILSSAECNYDKGYNFMIWDIESQQVIGTCSLTKIHPVHRIATFGINIGDRHFRNGGRGQDVIRCLLKFAFETLDLVNVDLGVYSFNEPAIACYEKSGFVEYGRRHSCRYVNGRRYDDILMEVTREEYEKGKTARS